VTVESIVADFPELGRYRRDALGLVEADVKYSGYIARQEATIEKMRRNETLRIPRDADYDAMGELRFESREKLKSHRPETIGQASRIPGVNPADVTILVMYLKRGVPVK
jgi:tRNA uridine 5-carboxymethylaminomethyl modification enzyme